MKKILMLVLAMVMSVGACFGLTACSCGGAKTIGYQTGTTGGMYINGDEDWGFEGFSNIEGKGYKTAALAATDLINGNLYAVVVDDMPAKAIVNSMNKGGNKLKIVDINLTSEKYAFGFKKGSAMVDDFNTFFEMLKTTGYDGETFDGIMAKYFQGEGTKKGYAYQTVSEGFGSAGSAGQLVIATNIPFSPFEYEDNGKMYGVDIEIAALYAKYKGLELVIKNMDFDSVLLAVQQGYADMGCAGLTVNNARLETNDFSTEYYNASQKLIVAYDNEDFDDCKTAADVEAILKSLNK